MQQNFESYLRRELRLSKHTVRAYVDDVNYFLRYLNINFNQIEVVDSKIIRNFIMHLMANKLSSKSVNRKISSLKKIFFWAKKNNLIEINPMLKIKSLKQEKRLPLFLKESEADMIEQLSDLFSNDFYGLRDKLMIEILYQTGIRKSELIQLKESDWSKSQIKVLGKRNKERIVPVSQKLTSIKNNYLIEKNSLFDSRELNLLVTDKGKKMYPKYVYNKINYYLSAVSTLSKKSPHILRHTFATHMLNNGAGIETIKELLGHESIVATQIYAHNSFEKLKLIYKQAHPRESN